MTLLLSQMNKNGGTQPRASVSSSVVDAYALDMQSGAVFPPIVVFYDGTTYWLADGFHRCAAAQKVGHDEIEAEVKQGTLEDAQWFSYGVNKEHDTAALRRTNADKRAAVEAALGHQKAPKLSNVEIAAHCGVSDETVRTYRKAILQSLEDSFSEKVVSDNSEGSLPVGNTASGEHQKEIPSLALAVPVMREVEVKRGDSSYTMKVPSPSKKTPRDKVASQIGQKSAQAIEQCATLEEWARFALGNRRRMETEDSPSFRLNMMDRLKTLLQAENETRIHDEQETPEPFTESTDDEFRAYEQQLKAEERREKRVQAQLGQLSTLFRDAA